MLVVATQETRLLPDRFVTDRISRPEDGKITFVHMLCFPDFERFSASGLRFSSDDEPDVVRLWSTRRRSVPAENDPFDGNLYDL
jgi:hypothetical protein